MDTFRAISPLLEVALAFAEAVKGIHSQDTIAEGRNPPTRRKIPAPVPIAHRHLLDIQNHQLDHVGYSIAGSIQMELFRSEQDPTARELDAGCQRPFIDWVTLTGHWCWIKHSTLGQYCTYHKALLCNMTQGSHLQLTPYTCTRQPYMGIFQGSIGQTAALTDFLAAPWMHRRLNGSGHKSAPQLSLLSLHLHNNLWKQKAGAIKWIPLALGAYSLMEIPCEGLLMSRIGNGQDPSDDNDDDMMMLVIIKWVHM